jgi:hypothetical protein
VGVQSVNRARRIKCPIPSPRSNEISRSRISLSTNSLDKAAGDGCSRPAVSSECTQSPRSAVSSPALAPEALWRHTLPPSTQNFWRQAFCFPSPSLPFPYLQQIEGDALSPQQLQIIPVHMLRNTPGSKLWWYIFKPHTKTPRMKLWWIGNGVVQKGGSITSKRLHRLSHDRPLGTPPPRLSHRAARPAHTSHLTQIRIDLSLIPQPRSRTHSATLHQPAQDDFDFRRRPLSCISASCMHPAFSMSASTTPLLPHAPRRVKGYELAPCDYQPIDHSSTSPVNTAP